MLFYEVNNLFSWTWVDHWVRQVYHSGKARESDDKSIFTKLLGTNELEMLINPCEFIEEIEKKTQ